MRFSHVMNIFLLMILTSTVWAQEVTLQEPPKGWECIKDPSQLPQKVKIIYIGISGEQSGFTPSLNIASESTSLSLDDYVKLAKTYHEGQRDTKCVLLGTVKTGAGNAQLLQIDRPSQWGDIRYLQAMLVNEQKAFVVTATCLKKDFGAYSTTILKAIQSASLADPMY